MSVCNLISNRSSDIDNLVSVVILSYNNYKHIFEAIDSVLSQSYASIEMIISDDASADFDADSLVQYIQAHRRANLQRYSVFQNKSNLGTVRNLNIAIKSAVGKYIIPFAADDKMFNCSVVSQIVCGFDKLSEHDCLLTTQVGMYDDSLENLLGYFIHPQHIELLQKGAPLQVYEQLVASVFIPGCGTCYKTAFFEKYGYFDESYFLVEDWPKYLQLTRSGVPICFFDIISFKHRDGGVSHSEGLPHKKTHTLFYSDMVRICEREILPYLNMIPPLRRLAAVKLYLSFTRNLTRAMNGGRHRPGYAFINIIKAIVKMMHKTTEKKHCDEGQAFSVFRRK